MKTSVSGGSPPTTTRPSVGRGRGSQWRPISRVRTYELVLDRIEEQILGGELRVGSRLPPERDLAAMLGVSRSAVREAMRSLEAQGVVHAAVGTGPDSGTTVGSESGEALTRLLMLHVALANFPISQVVETRVMLERWSVQLAVRNATPQQLAGLRELVTAMDDPRVGREEFNSLDTAFHVAIAEAGGNRLVTDITTAIRESLRSTLLGTLTTVDDWREVADHLRAEHRRLCDLLAARRADQAAEVMERHIRDFDQERRTEQLRQAEQAS